MLMLDGLSVDERGTSGAVICDSGDREQRWMSWDWDSYRNSEGRTTSRLEALAE
jgi:hypothetical protein